MNSLHRRLCLQPGGCGISNVILLHSMTKRFAVPGLRLGYITACKELLHEIRTQRMPWSVNQLAIEAGHYLLSSSQYDIDIYLLLREKKRLVQSLLSIGEWRSGHRILTIC